MSLECEEQLKPSMTIDKVGEQQGRLCGRQLQSGDGGRRWKGPIDRQGGAFWPGMGVRGEEQPGLRHSPQANEGHPQPGPSFLRALSQGLACFHQLHPEA